MSKKGNFLIQAGLMVLVLATIGKILFSRREELAQIIELNSTTFIVMSIATIGAFILNGVILQVLAAHFNSRISLKETVMLGLLASTLNYLPMKSGTVLNGIIMKTRYGVSLSHFAALVMGNNVLNLWVTSTMAGVFLLCLGYVPTVAWFLILVPSATLTVLIWWGMVGGRGKDMSGRPRLTRAAYNAVTGLRTIFSNLRLVILVMGVNVGLIILAAIRFYSVFRGMEVSIGWMGSLVVASIAVVTHRLSFLPGGLGFREGGVVAGAVVVGVSSTVGLAAAVIERGVIVFWILMIGVPATFYLSRATGLSFSQQNLNEEDGVLEDTDQNMR